LSQVLQLFGNIAELLRHISKLIIDLCRLQLVMQSQRVANLPQISEISRTVTIWTYQINSVPDSAL
jgi:hypothetical protein